MLESLGHFPLFKDLECEDLQTIAPLFHLRTFPAGAVVIEQGEKAVCLYLLTDGKATIRYKPYDGEIITLNHLHAGGVFGWSAVLGNDYYSASVICDTACEVLVVKGKDLRNLEAKRPQTAQSIMNLLAGAVSTRWENAQAQVRSMLRRGITENVAPLASLGKGKQNMSPAVASPKEQQLKVLLEQLSAYIEQYHGGSVEFVAFDGEILKVRLGGACLGCPLSPSTLHGWVEGTVRQFFPEISAVEAV